jgi:uncharacterized protein with PIN domain
VRALARRLRLLGFDCLYDRRWDDAELASISADQNRILLTRDRGLLKRAIVTHGICLHSDCPDEQLKEVLARLDLRGAPRPFSRCALCNGRLEAVAPESVKAEVPVRTYRYVHEYYRCAGCGKVFWKGTHWPRLQRIIRLAAVAACVHYRDGNRPQKNGT